MIAAEASTSLPRAEPAARARLAQTALFWQTLRTLRNHVADALPEVLTLFTASLGHALQVERTSIWLFDASRTAIECHDLFLRSPQKHQRGMRLAAADFPRYFAALADHESILADDAQTHPATREFSGGYLLPLGITSLLDVPIHGRDLLGVFCCEHTGPARQWTEEEQRFVIAATSCVTLALEVSERRRSETELRSVRERLEQALLATNICTWTSEATTGLITLDASWAQMRGFPPIETVTSMRALRAVVHPDDRATGIAKLRSAIEGETDEYVFEHQVKTATGGWLWILSRGRVMERDVNGKATRLIGTNADISARKAAEAALQTLHNQLERLVEERTSKLARSENQLRLTWENALVGMRLTDADGIVVRVNDAYCQLMGQPRAALEGQSMAAPYPDKHQAEILAKHRRRFLSHTVPPRLETSVTLRDHSVCWLEQSNAFVRSPGEPELLLGVFLDLTERKRSETALRQSEALFRGVFDASPIPILLTSVPEGRLTDMNAAATAVFGYTREEALGHTTSELGIYAQPEQRAAFLGRIAAEGSVTGFEAILRTKSGAERIMLCTGAPIMIAGNKRLLASVQDITAFRSAEAEKNRLQAQIFQSQKHQALGTLAGGVAHDFNNILTGILTYTELAQEDCPPTHPQIKEFLGEVLKSGLRAKELVGQILLFSRSEDAPRAPVLLQRVISEVVKLLRSTLPAAVEINSIVDPRAPVVLANATQLHQVVLNLGINAAHALQAKGGLLSIRLQSRMVDSTLADELTGLQPGPHVHLEITDTGSGMTPEVLARIFEPFFTTKKVGEGAGLGLAVVRSIVLGHHGAIRVRSQPRSGTTFELFFPSHGAATAITHTEKAALHRGRGQLIFLADDEPIVANAVALMIERLGYRVIHFTRPEEALARFETSPGEVDLLITDFQMPGMTGFALAQKFLAKRPTLPVLIASGFTGAMTAAQLREPSITDCLQKPFDLAELSRALAKALA
jgi:PAS domain S-box-containing protein